MTIEERLDKLEQERNVWRSTSVGLLLAGVVFGLTISSAGSSRKERQRALDRDEPHTPQAADAANIHDRLRVRSLEVVASDGSLVGVFRSVGTGDTSRGHLELIGRRHSDWGTVTIRPNNVTISSEAGAAELEATSAIWTPRSSSGRSLDQPVVRIGARDDGGYVNVHKTERNEFAMRAGDPHD